MATYYVNKSGSDANNGTTPTLAKVTIQAGLNLMATGDSLVVGSGSYAERVTLATDKSLTFYADGVVVMDGTSLSGSGYALSFATGQGTAAVRTISVLPSLTGGKWVIKNYNVSSATLGVVRFDGTSANGINANIKNMEVYGNINNTVGVSGPYMNCTATLCVFSGFSGYGVYESTTHGASTVCSLTHNTFYNCGYGCYLVNTPSLLSVFYNIFHTCTTGTRRPSAPTVAQNNNDYYNCTNMLDVTTTHYTTLPAVQAVGSELTGTNTNPNLIDPANGVFFMSSLSAYGAHSYSSFTHGALANSDGKWIVTASADNTGWYNADGNITKNVTDGAFELTAGTSGVIVSPVYDLGSNLSNTKISLVTQQTWPTNMVDQTKTDIRPNYQTVSIRASATTFNQDDVSPSWVESNIESPLTGINGQWVQVKMTLRSDDVAG